MAPQNIIILGMHRSGTSLVAGTLARAGVYCGETDELLAVQADNPLGFFERRDVVQCNDALLEAAGGSWFAPPNASETAVGKAATIRDITERLHSHSPWLLKDPRMALTWPAWREALSGSLIIYVYRNPVAVAQSLHRRNGFSLQMGLALWEYYNAACLQILKDSGAALALSYDELARDPEAQFDRLRGALQAAGLSVDGIEAQAFKGDLNHGDVRHEDSPLLRNSHRALALQCEALCRDECAPSEIELTGEANREVLDDLVAAYRGLPTLQELERRVQTLERELTERTSERDISLRELRGLETQHEALALVHQRDEQEIADLRQRVHRLDEIQDALDQRVLAHEDSLQRIHELEYSHAPMYLVNRVGGGILDALCNIAGWFKRRIANLYRRMVGLAPIEDERLVVRQTGAGTQSKLVLAGDVIKYVARNPAGSARSFSLPRLKRAMAVFLNSNNEDLSVWINARFPQSGFNSNEMETYDLDASYDSLELSFPHCERPRVSIVVPVFNQYRMTMQCLQSVLQHTDDVEYELIVADDCSEDLTISLAERVGNITVVRGETNRGFVENCNAGAAYAVGEHILFLNNDTNVTDGWLSALLRVMDEDASAGVVGPKLLFADGRLQEAGGIIWDDASGWNYGRMDDPDKPEFNYRRETDYVSGACLLVRRSLWREIGGFDKRYVPAYYEDTDLAFACRQAGYRVIYQPASRVYHFEGVSNGTDLESGLKQYQVTNQVKFREKWAAQLSTEHYPNAFDVFRARDRSRYRRCVLIIDHYVPHYDKDAGSRSTFMYVQLLVRMGYSVKFLGANYFPHKPYTETLQQLGVEVLVGEWMARNQDAWLQENAAHIDCIYLHRPHIAEQVLGSLYKMEPRPPIIYFGHDLHYLRTERELEVSGNPALRKEAASWKRREFAVFDKVDRVYFPSQVEIDEIQPQRTQLPMRAIPLYALDIQSPPAYDPASREDILFVGGFNHPPNVDGICWFVEEVWPQVLAERPQMRLHVVGSNPSDAVQDLQSESVRVYGYLSDEDLEGLYRRVRQAVVPLRFGAGVKGKVIEALQHGVPLTTTSIGAEGIPDAEQVMNVVDDAQSMARQVIAIDQAEPEALARVANYGSYLHENFSADAVADILREDFGNPRLDVSPRSEDAA